MAKFFKKLISGGYGGMNFGGGGKGGGGYEFKPYGGLRPPRIDTPEKQILRPTQSRVFDLLMAGSQGEGVGYSPERKTAALALLTSQIQKQKEDDMRAARGRVSASGLSGNLRAQEALTGRVERDSARSLAEQTNLLNIEDLGVQQREREADKRALQQLDLKNFSQENKVADFDLSAFQADEGNRLAAAGFNEGIRQYDTGRQDDIFSGIAELAGTGIGTYFGGPVGGAVGGQSVSALLGKSSGRGLSPSMDYYNPMAPGQKHLKAYRSLVR